MTTLKQLQQRTLGALAFTSAMALSLAPAFAAAPTVTTGGTGEQINTMAAEAMNTGGTIFDECLQFCPFLIKIPLTQGREGDGL